MSLVESSAINDKGMIMDNNNHTKNGNGIDENNPQISKDAMESTVNTIKEMDSEIWGIIQKYSESEKKNSVDVRVYLAKCHTAIDLTKARLLKMKLREIEGREAQKDYIKMMLKAQY